MAWLGRFDDFDQFDGDFAGKPTFKQNPNIRHRGPNQQQQQISRNPTEVKRLCDITSHSSYVTLIGIIIAKEEQRSVFSKKNVGTERHLVSFTLRDSPSCFVNVTCWGNAEFINNIGNNFDVGNVVQLKNVQVQQKAANQNDEKFKPWTPVSFQVNVSENHGTVESYTGWDAATYRNTLSLPTRPSNDYYTLEDINISGMALQGEHINILAAVKKVGQIRYLTTKTGKQTKKCDVVLFDDTCSSFSLDLWQNHADTTLLWTPFETVLFCADVKITFNNFRSSMVATADSKTIFTTDPDTREAHCLHQFLRTQDRTSGDTESDVLKTDLDPDLSSITEEFTVQQLKEKRATMAQDTTANKYYGLLSAVLTHFNIDASNEAVVRRVCGRCRKFVSNTDFAICTNPNCSMNYAGGAAGPSNSVIVEYNLSVSLSDHSGTVSFCRLQPAVVEALFGCQPEAFLMMPEDQRTHLKWQYLLEKCNTVFKLKKFKPGPGQLPTVQILSMERKTYAQNTSRLQRLH